jgi:hypothetical protein
MHRRHFHAVDITRRKQSAHKVSSIFMLPMFHSADLFIAYYFPTDLMTPNILGASDIALVIFAYQIGINLSI